MNNISNPYANYQTSYNEFMSAYTTFQNSQDRQNYQQQKELVSSKAKQYMDSIYGLHWDRLTQNELQQLPDTYELAERILTNKPPRNGADLTYRVVSPFNEN